MDERSNKVKIEILKFLAGYTKNIPSGVLKPYACHLQVPVRV